MRKPRYVGKHRKKEGAWSRCRRVLVRPAQTVAGWLGAIADLRSLLDPGGDSPGLPLLLELLLRLI